MSFSKTRYIYESSRVNYLKDALKTKSKANHKSKEGSTCETSLNYSDLKQNSPTLWAKQRQAEKRKVCLSFNLL